MDSLLSTTFTLQTPATPLSDASPGPASAFDLANFSALYQSAAPTATPTVAALPEGEHGFTAAIKALDSLNSGALDLGQKASHLANNLQELTPGDMLQLTMHAHHFVFQAQLTANVANRTSEGVQQLFRQQS